MEWSTDLYHVAQLEEYLVPEVWVADFVRDQLITNDQKDAMTVAICQVTKLWRTITEPYDVFVNYTCLDWTKEQDVDEVFGMIRRGMFDLMLGDRMRRTLVNRYEEVRVVRSRFEDFILFHGALLKSHCKEPSLWWDSIGIKKGPLKAWVSGDLAGDKDFTEVVASWLEDGRRMQNWLRDYEEKGILANNPSLEDERVFSEEMAIEIMKFAKVRV